MFLVITRVTKISKVSIIEGAKSKVDSAASKAKTC